MRRTARGCTAFAGSPPALLALLEVARAQSGSALAAQLGLSPGAVRKQIAALRAAGLEIDSDRCGYRLVQALDWLGVDAVGAALPPALRRRVGSLENHWQIDSTSSACLRRAATLPDCAFVFADWQLAGRGRRGRQWVSPPAANLQFSCLKRFAGGYASLAGLSLAVGVAVADALSDCGVADVGLKWPNDLVHADAKLGGILVELGGDAAGPCHAVIGIGINVRLPEAMRVALARDCIDLAGLCGAAAPTRNALAAAVVRRLVLALDRFDAAGFAAFATAWAVRDALAGRRVRIAAPQGAFDGVAEGVDPRGALRVRGPAGVRCLDSADVSVRAK